MKERLRLFAEKETVFCISFILAVISVFFVPPDRGYAGYIDMRTLGLLFSLMAVMAGFQKTGVFRKMADCLLIRVRTQRALCTVLVMLCFFTAMLITNDVALITFIPFSILLLKMTGMQKKAVEILIMQTVAANLGSMLTPIGNPQNLYLYSASGMKIREFVGIMLPLTLLSFFLLLVFCAGQKKHPVTFEIQQREKNGKKDRIVFGGSAALFLLSILAVLHVVPYQAVVILVLLFFFMADRALLKKPDYMLLLTFVCFFILIGNIGRIEAVHRIIQAEVQGREMLAGFLSSQLISNVPAAVLLSGFTDNWQELLKGVNIGGLGTLIASMASLITYKFLIQEYQEEKGRFLKVFTIRNLEFAAVLLAAGWFLR